MRQFQLHVLGMACRQRSGYSGAMPDRVLDFEALAKAKLSEEAFAYLQGGADDERTLAAS